MSKAAPCCLPHRSSRLASTWSFSATSSVVWAAVSKATSSIKPREMVSGMSRDFSIREEL